MFDHLYNLNKQIHAEMLETSKTAQLLKAAVEQRKTTPPPKEEIELAAVLKARQEHLQSLTDTEALMRKVRADLVRNAQAEFAAVMDELNASGRKQEAHKRGRALALDKEDIGLEESGDAFETALCQSEPQPDHIGEA
jgi:hypothetical protein